MRIALDNTHITRHGHTIGGSVPFWSLQGLHIDNEPAAKDTGLDKVHYPCVYAVNCSSGLIPKLVL